LTAGFPRVLHVVAGAEPVNFLHQDAFKAAFWAAYRALPDGAVVHLTSRDEALPTMRDLWELWFSTHGGPREVHFFDRLDELPVEVRLLLEFIAVNNEIASVRWNFCQARMEDLRRNGLQMNDATLATIRVAQRRFVADSPRVQRFIVRCRAAGASTPQFV